jgi:SAM-dependent methyltransferase
MAEPEPLFLPLSQERAAHFYALEMDGFTADVDFYRRWLPQRGTLLELGCGTARLARQLADGGRTVVAIDNSLPMLALARRYLPPGLRLVCTDLLAPGLKGNFAAIVIAYNTLNLLATPENVRQCLGHCRRLLAPDGLLLVQLHLPGAKSTGRRGKTFQFQFLPLPTGGRVIKEVLREYLPETATILVEERYRVRPSLPAAAKEDLAHRYPILAFSRKEWQALFTAAGFTSRASYGSYALTPWSESATTLLEVLAVK